MAIPKYDPKLDKLYPRTIRCPYCKDRIYAYTTTCKTCGLTKRQITGASHQRAKEMIKNKEKGKIVMTKRRPDDLDMVRFSLWLCVGFVGAHNFYVGRKVRGWIMASFLIAYVVCFAVFPPAGTFYPGSPASSVRAAFGNTLGGVFPTDFFGVIPVLVWFYDIFAIILFRTYKYPVRLADNDEKRIRKA